VNDQQSPSWIEKLAELRTAGRPCAMVVVTAVRGSAPREPGARMLLCGGELVWGTIGGGNLEKLAIEHVAALLERPGNVSETVVYPLAEKTGQCCGGEVTLFFETFHWTQRTVAVFGAGHVGQALGALAPWLKVRVLLVDGRAEEELVPRIPPRRPYELLCIDSPEAEIDELPPDSLVVVMTHSHALDLEIVERALRRGSFPFVGLIGSERKWQRFRTRLVQKGLSEAQVDSVTCPLGGKRASKDPAAIALATATQLVEVMDSLVAP
jgi:xanthine dehydrogenase accessory factor